MRCLVVALFALRWQIASCVVGGHPAAAPEPDAAVVFADKFGRSARVEGIKDNAKGYYCFLGLRYAEPPVGQLRFARAVYRRLAGELLASTPCAPCAQPGPTPTSPLLGREDCLCLNIYTPQMPGDEAGSPIVFFVHGGNYRRGSASLYGGVGLTQKDTILVSVQYRLGSLGFLSTEQKAAEGNAGLYDLTTALQWVDDYIEFFGGDRRRITVMGQGSGGGAASLLAVSPLAGRSVAGLVALSGGPLSSSTLRKEGSASGHARELADRAGCPGQPSERLLACLRQLPYQRLLQADIETTNDTVIDTQQFLSEIAGIRGFGARSEGVWDERSLEPVVPREPKSLLNDKPPSNNEENTFLRVPMLSGTTQHETARAVLGPISKHLLSALQNIPDLIQKDILGPLKIMTPDLPLNEVANGITSVSELAGKLLSLETYYGILAQGSPDIAEALNKISEATSDALFNYPAFLSVDRWSAYAPAYLYSFEYDGNLAKGDHFLPFSALTTQEGGQQKGLVSHGDDLAYIFEPLNMEGRSDSDGSTGSTGSASASQQDHLVRDQYTGLIANFAHHLHPLGNSSTLNLFSSKDSQYIKIADKVTVEQNYRFCQMGLWGGLASRLTSSTCSILANSKQLVGKFLPAALSSSLTELPKKQLQPHLPPVIPKIPDIPLKLPFNFKK